MYALQYTKRHVGARLRMQTSALLSGSPSRRANGFAHGLAPALTAHQRSTRYRFLCVCVSVNQRQSSVVTLLSIINTVTVLKNNLGTGRFLLRDPSVSLNNGGCVVRMRPAEELRCQCLE